MIEMLYLRNIIAAAERGSFRAAARTLSIQESVVSRRIRELEDRIRSYEPDNLITSVSSPQIKSLRHSLRSSFQNSHMTMPLVETC